MEQNTPIAIIGMGCFFPKASGVKEYWRLLSRGQDAITEVPETHWSPADYFDKDPKKPDHVYCTRGGFISPAPFDPTEFGIPPSILEATDTSQLLGLVAAKTALEDAGYGDNGREFRREKTSVILGVTGTQELVIPLGARLGHPIWRKALLDAGIPPEKAEEVVERIADGYVPWQENSFPGLLGNVVAGRISNRLNLGGTNCSVDAACASSMSAMHLALMELKTGRTDMAVTGGVDTLNDIFMHMCFSKTPILSPTGDVRPFSKDADGSLLGEGIGLLVFKRLADAERDGDRIYAVIRALGSSSDGRSNSIYAPLAEGQMKALHMAYETAQVDPTTVELIEAHGTGTRVGDAVEFSGLKKLFSEQNADHGQNQCAVGSVKSMIGHTKAAAGAAGLIKTVLSLYHKVLPPTLKISEADPKLEIENSPFYLNTQVRPWIGNPDHPRRAGVSAFGFGGSNFHMVLEEYRQDKSDVSWDSSVEIVALSGASREELEADLSRFRSDVEQGMTDEEVSARAAEMRAAFSPGSPHRLLLVLEKTLDRFENLTEVVTDALTAFRSNLREKAWNVRNVFYGGPQEPGKVAFLFPGQGSQYTDMGKDLTCRFPEALEILDQVNAATEGNERLSDFIYPCPARDEGEKSDQETRLRSTDVAQPAIGAVSTMMMKILERFGLKPDATCGHSFGELVALHAAGWIDADTLFELAFTRGRLMAEAGKDNGGTMTAVKASLEKIDALIREENLDVVLANRNSPDQGVLSGSAEAIEKAELACKERNMSFRRLPVSAAFHSRLLKDAQKPFAEAVQGIRITPTETPVFSNTTGNAYPTDPEAAKKILAEQLLSPVDFVNEIKGLFNLGVHTFVEIGPKSVLTGLVKAILKGLNFNALSLDASSGRRFGIADLARLLCYLAALGHPIDLKAWEHPVSRKRKQRMSIPLSGANYRSPSKKKKVRPKPVQKPTSEQASPNTPPSRHTPAPVKKEQKVQKAAAVQTQPSTSAPVRADIRHRKQQALPEKRLPARASRLSRTEPDKQIMGNTMTMNKKTPPRNPALSHEQGYFVTDAFRAVQEGLRSMQALQMQTAETHQKFLETQRQASRTLEEMMASTRQLAEASMGFHQPSRPVQYVERSRPAVPAISEPMPVAPTPEAPQMAAQPVHSANVRQESSRPANAVQTPVPSPAAPTVAPQMRPETPAPAPVAETPAQAASATGGNGNGNGKKKIESAMLSVVSELTGYPSEMLSMDMDIEADLGIDSIKRVEILSTFEEKMPGLPSVSPEVMGTLKTLGQIVEYLTGARIEESTPAPSPSPQTETPAPVVETPSGNRQEIEAAMLAVVSELTGYPSEMLSMYMDIEADLGIDSIKRVEILSAFEEKMPDLPSVSPEVMGTLKTLGQIVEYLTGGSDDAAPAQAPAVTNAEIADTPQPETASPSSASGNRQEIESAMLSVVTELTGYPTEMLSMDMEIEADLGIDSIKRVEILSEFESKMPDLPSVSPEVMGTLKTLGQIVDYLTGESQSDQPPQQQATPTPPEIIPGDVKKKIISLTRQPLDTGSPVTIPADLPIFVTKDKRGLGEAIVEAFAASGMAAVLASPSQLRERDDLPSPGGLVILADAWEKRDDRFLKEAFKLAHDMGSGLLESARQGGALFATVTRMDGAFGFAGTGFENALQGGLAGLAKTALAEWSGVCCHAVDIAPTWEDPEAIARSVVAELTHRGPVEVGLTPDGRFVPTPEPSPYPQGKIDLAPGDVVVITGGARGVTAATALALARQVRPTLVLLGRSPFPSAEPEWLASLSDEAAMKKAILAYEFSDHTATPVELEKVFKKYRANREITENLHEMRSAGANVLYHSADVRDAGSVRAVLTEIRAAHGPVRAVIHGAGTLADRFIVDKTPEQFAQVFDTKVKGLDALLEATADDPLRYLILFSSVAARMGNKGQVDYAMANEVLNKIGQREALKRPDCRVISFNWGPWDGGMVSPALKREFTRNNIELIPVEAGAQCMVAEMTGDTHSPVEVVIGAGLVKEDPPKPDAKPEEKTGASALSLVAETPSAPSGPSLSLSFEREVDVDRFPILKAHVLNGVPVVPFALMAEWLGHGALHENPGLFLHGLDDMRLLKGIRLDQGAKPVSLMAGKARRNGEFYEADVELGNGKDLIHSRAKAILTDTPSHQPPAFRPSVDIRSKSYTRPMSEVYEQILFHGTALHGIRDILECSPHVMVAKLGPAPSPAQWMSEPLRSQWIGDPLVLDAAFQMAIVWCYEEKGVLSLPSYLASYRQYCNRFPSDGVTALLEVKETSSSRMKGDFTFLDAQDQIVARLSGYEAVMDNSLFKAFKAFKAG